MKTTSPAIAPSSVVNPVIDSPAEAAFYAFDNILQGDHSKKAQAAYTRACGITRKEFSAHMRASLEAHTKLLIEKVAAAERSISVG